MFSREQMNWRARSRNVHFFRISTLGKCLTEPRDALNDAGSRDAEPRTTYIIAAAAVIWIVHGNNARPSAEPSPRS